MHVSLARESLSLVWRLRPSFIIWNVIDIIANSVCDLILGMQYPIWLWVASRFVSSVIVGYILRREADLFLFQLTQEWVENYAYRPVEAATHYSRYEMGDQMFIENKNKAMDAVWRFIQASQANVPNAISTVLSCGILAWQHPVLIAAGSVWCAAIWVLSLSWSKWFSGEFKRLNELFTEATVGVRMRAPMFQTGIISADTMINIEMKPMHESVNIDANFNTYITSKMFGLNAIFVLIPQFADPIFAAMLFERLIRRLNSLMQFELHYNRMKSPYDKYRKMIMSLDQEAPVADATTDLEQIVIESIHIAARQPPAKIDEPEPVPSYFHRISQNMMDLVMKLRKTHNYTAVNTELQEFPKYAERKWHGIDWDGILEMGKGVHIIEGPSGGGKSTLVNAITGKIPGVHLRGTWQPGNLRKRFAVFYQALKSKMPFSDITVEQLFDGAAPDKIQPVAEACCIWEKLCNLGYDKKIVQDLSGGERTRIALATVCYAAIRDNLPYIVLDEPEQGLDPDLAYQVMSNIFAMFHDRVIIVVSHLERAATEFPWVTLTHVTSECVRVEINKV